MEHKVSIIIPHYNSATLLERMINSIPNKENIEIIIVDDKSDKELEKFQKIKEQKQKIIFLDNTSEKKGAGTSRNIGLEKVSGEWVLFADADDIFLSDFYKIIEPYLDCDAEIVYFKPTSKKEDGTDCDRHYEFANFVTSYLNNPNDKKAELELKYRFTPPWSKLIRRELIEREQIRFDEVRYSNDVMFSVKTAYYAKKILAVDREIYCVIENSKSLTAQGDDFSGEQRTEILIHRYKFLKERLSKKEFYLLDLSALGRIMLSVRNKNTSMDSKIKVIKMVCKARMRIIPRKIFSPAFWRQRIK